MELIKSLIDQNPSVRREELEDVAFGTMMRYPRILDYKRRRQEPRNFKSICLVFVGPPGKGKSTLMKILARYLGKDVYYCPQKKGSGQYYDDYDGQDVFLLDEFDGDRMRPTEFNSLVDEHPHVLPVHGAAGHQMRSKFVLIGTNYAPKFWWRKRNEMQLRQTLRRIDVIFKVGMKGPIELAQELARRLIIVDGKIVGSKSAFIKD